MLHGHSVHQFDPGWNILSTIWWIQDPRILWSSDFPSSTATRLLCAFEWNVSTAIVMKSTDNYVPQWVNWYWWFPEKYYRCLLVQDMCVLITGKTGDTQDISTNYFPKNRVTLQYRSGGPRLPLRFASILSKLQINSAEEPDKDSPHYYNAKPSTI